MDERGVPARVAAGAAQSGGRPVPRGGRPGRCQVKAAADPFLEAAGLDAAKNSVELAAALTGKCKTLADYPEKARFCLEDAVVWNPKPVRKFLKPDNVPAIQAVRDALAEVDPFTKDAIEAALTPVIEAHGGIKKAGQLIRVSATGTNVS
ncbi:MAG: hypothetical protein ACYTGX_18300, partial [Planctomycetota bacterium]